MLALAKFLHFIGLMTAAGAALGQMVVARQIRTGRSVAELQGLRALFARIGLGGILLLWLTGLWLYLGFYGGAPLGGVFHLKLAAATLLLLVSAVANLAIARARRSGTPPPAWLPRLGMTTPLLALIAVGAAVVVFN